MCPHLYSHEPVHFLFLCAAQVLLAPAPLPPGPLRIVRYSTLGTELSFVPLSGMYEFLPLSEAID